MCNDPFLFFYWCALGWGKSPAFLLLCSQGHAHSRCSVYINPMICKIHTLQLSGEVLDGRDTIPCLCLPHRSGQRSYTQVESGGTLILDYYFHQFSRSKAPEFQIRRVWGRCACAHTQTGTYLFFCLGCQEIQGNQISRKTTRPSGVGAYLVGLATHVATLVPCCPNFFLLEFQIPFGIRQSVH